MKKYIMLRMAMMFLAVYLMNLGFGILPIQASPEFSIIQPVEENLMLMTVRDWGKWSAHSTYDGLDMRVRCEGYNEDTKGYKWNVQFSSRYKDTIHFGWEISDKNVPVTRTTNRTTLRSGGISAIGFGKSLITPCGSGTIIVVFVSTVRFGENDSGPYYVKPN